MTVLGDCLETYTQARGAVLTFLGAACVAVGAKVNGVDPQIIAGLGLFFYVVLIFAVAYDQQQSASGVKKPSSVKAGAPTDDAAIRAKAEMLAKKRSNGTKQQATKDFCVPGCFFGM
mmetsp:Transcript_60295/g.136308  ORF Transcript_60295/g.136308 Transcript_60295/m.136308 type:complete len:117 (-) Transcript_60295:486-836(-)|eukprot:CAMPEP_0172595144 /NCGR_PEP_ID=MMETSP1068-20121228/14717_1 /TAXON_ID=35684 /ORGANISM="Pseudopedinella elastica, Strain CCMP716" /LENGTH=116 /DNA_ID=CAMNT_0013393557 /DNA_START=92 /DNA_END=442 /DNA_ORIENTATION=-